VHQTVWPEVDKMSWRARASGAVNVLCFAKSFIRSNPLQTHAPVPNNPEFALRRVAQSGNKLPRSKFLPSLIRRWGP
jgi:hypothetical protein